VILDTPGVRDTGKDSVGANPVKTLLDVVGVIVFA
jgi:hypothetical protein